MEFTSRLYNFKVYRCFDVLRFQFFDLYEMPDFAYGEFVFEVKGLPEYYYACFDNVGNNKQEIGDVRDIPAYLSQKISVAITEKVTRLNEKRYVIIRLRDLGIQSLLLKEIVSF